MKKIKPPKTYLEKQRAMRQKQRDPDIAPYSQESFSPHDRYALANLVSRLDSPTPRICEIGSWLGTGSTETIIKTLQGKDYALYCVDTWQGSANVAEHMAMNRNYDLFKTFCHNIKSLNAAEYVNPLVMGSQAAAAIVADHSFDLVFIDADHRYHNTKSDIALWRNKVKPGGILAGHDCEARYHDFPETFIESNLNVDAVKVDAYKTAVLHCGVVKAVHEAFQDQVNLWVEQNLEAEGLEGFGTIWYKIMDK